MADTKISSEETYQGIYPSVFKKIDNSDVTINPFQTYKSWTVLSGSSTSSCLPLNAIYSDILPALETELTYNDAKNVDNSLQTVIYDSINHLFYKYRTQPYNTLGPTNLNVTPKFLYQSASVLSFPYKKIGEGIKPASFTFTGSEFPGGGEPILRIYSDRYGNLYSSTFPTASIVNGVTFYEGFNECFDASRCNFDSRNVTFVPGVEGTGGSGAVLIGTAANFSNPGYIKTTLNGDYSRDTDYAVSVWAQSLTDLSVQFGGSNHLLIGKVSGSNITQYPFKIEVNGNLAGISPKLVCSVKGGTQIASLEYEIFTSGWIHLLFQKTGSKIELYTDGILQSSASAAWLTNTFNPLTVSTRIDNDHPLMIGGTGVSGETFSGSIDEIRIFNRALTIQEIDNLTERRGYAGFEFKFLQTNHVGNVFSKQGIVVVSTLDPRFHNILQQPYTASYKSTLTSYELGVVTKLDAGDFNLSLNPTLTRDNDITYHSFVTGSTFAPYITTIGLYNDAGQLLAVGKLAQPIRKRNDVDINFLVRIDLDKNITPATVLSPTIKPVK